LKTKIKLIVGLIILALGVISFSSVDNVLINPSEATTTSRIETFTFSLNGTTIKGKIFLPASYETKKNLPAIYLIDYAEQHFKIATDEFEKVIESVQQIKGFDALIVTLEEHLDNDVKPKVFKEYYNVFKSITAYVDSKYTAILLELL
jgi:hypothetical protein